jgi:hypothetical protein
MRIAPLIRLHGDGVDDAEGVSHIVRRSHRRSGAAIREPDRRAHDRHGDDVHSLVSNVRFPWHRDTQRLPELTASGNITAVIRRS